MELKQKQKLHRQLKKLTLLNSKNMKKIQYLEIFKKSLAVSWKHRILWWFGFFIFLSSLFGNFNYQNNEKQNASNLSSKLLSFFQLHPFLSLGILISLLLLMLALFALSIVSRASIIKTVANLELYSKQNFSFLFKEGMAHLAKLFQFEMLFFFSLLSLLIILATPIVFLFSLNSIAFGIIATLIAIAIFIPIIFFAFFCHQYTYLYRVLGNVKILQAIEASYFLFRKNLKEGFLTSIFLLLASIAFFAGLMLTGFLFALILVIVGVVPYFIFGKTVLLVLGIFGICAFLIFFTIAFSFFEVFKQAVWVLFFQEITNPKIPERIEEVEAIEQVQANALG